MTPLTHTSTGRLWLGWELKNMRPPTGSFFDLSTGVFWPVVYYIASTTSYQSESSHISANWIFIADTQLPPSWSLPGITLAKRKVFFIILSRGLKTWNNAHRLYPVAHVWNGVLGYWKGNALSVTAELRGGAVGSTTLQSMMNAKLSKQRFWDQ